MKTYADDAERIVNELHGTIDYTSQYCPLMDAVGQLSDFEATGKTPEDIRVMTCLLSREGIEVFSEEAPV